jgi:hypothetical protein
MPDVSGSFMIGLARSKRFDRGFYLSSDLSAPVLDNNSKNPRTFSGRPIAAPAASQVGRSRDIRKFRANGLVASSE